MALLAVVTLIGTTALAATEATFRISPSKVNGYFTWSARGGSYAEGITTYAFYDPDGPAGPAPARALRPWEVEWTSGDERVQKGRIDGSRTMWTARAGRPDPFGFPVQGSIQPYATSITAKYKGMKASISVKVNIGIRPGSDRPYFWVFSPGKLFSGLPYAPYDNNAPRLLRDAHFAMTVKVGERKAYPAGIATGFGEETEKLSDIIDLVDNARCNWTNDPTAGVIACDNRYRITGVTPGITLIYHPGVFQAAGITITQVTVTPSTNTARQEDALAMTDAALAEPATDGSDTPETGLSQTQVAVTELADTAQPEDALAMADAALPEGVLETDALGVVLPEPQRLLDPPAPQRAPPVSFR